MNKKNWKIGVIVKSVPHLELVPENLMEVFVTGIIESMEICRGKSKDMAEINNKE